MKKLLCGTLMLLMMLLAACAPRIYGVPQERWETMSEQERVAAMEAYKARQEVLRQQREKQARLRAMEREAQLAREAEEARQRQLRVDAIYRGKGLYGDLLRITLKGGMLQFRGDHKNFHPVSFKIAAEEMKDVEIVSVRGIKTHMTVYYDGSNLLLDETPNSHRSTALRLPYEDTWETGTTYPERFAKGPLEMRGVDVTVRIVGEPPREPHARRHRQHAVAKPPIHTPQKPTVIVIEEPQRHPEPGVTVREHRPQAWKPDITVSKPQPAADQHGKIIAHRPRKNDVVPIPPARIKVVFRKGHFMVKKRSYPLVPQAIELQDGQVRNLVMRGHDANLKIQLSYRGGELLINDVPGDGRTATRVDFIPGWKNGQQYAIEASGNRLLKNLDILIVSQ